MASDTSVGLGLATRRVAAMTNQGYVPRNNRKRPVEERFWEKVDRSGDCWLWTAYVGARGYAYIVTGGRVAPAHRLAYEWLVGPIPEGLEIDHLCRVRHCVNPAHLEPVTHRENDLRGVGIAAQNARKTHCERGHPLSGDNIRIRKEGWRTCLFCEQIRVAKWQSRHPSPHDTMRGA